MPTTVETNYAAYLVQSAALKKSISEGTHTALSGPDLAAVAALAEEIAAKSADPIGILLDAWTSPRHQTGSNRNYVIPGDIVGG